VTHAHLASSSFTVVAARPGDQDENFHFLYIFPLNFAKLYGPEKNLQNYTSSAVRDEHDARGHAVL
jgi:hypothetical protein